MSTNNFRFLLVVQPTGDPTAVFSEIVYMTGEAGKNGCISFTSSTTMVTSVRVTRGNVAESCACVQAGERRVS